jgi:hypothetical protein
LWPRLIDSAHLDIPPSKRIRQILSPTLFLDHLPAVATSLSRYLPLVNVLENQTVKSSDTAFTDKERQPLVEERGEARTGGHERIDGRDMRFTAHIKSA